MSTETVFKSLQERRADLQNCINFLKVITSAHDSAAPGNLLMGALRLLCHFGKSVPYLGVILASVEGMLPCGDEGSNQVVHLLQDLREQIKGIKDDMTGLSNKIEWESVKSEYGEIVHKIEEGINYLLIINQSADGKKERYKKRLKDLCSNQQMTLAVGRFLKGLTGKGPLQSDILDIIYRNTRGHRGLIAKMCFEFLQLFTGGLAVISAYETLEHGIEGASDMIKYFEGDEEKLETRFEEYQRKCIASFTDHMEKDFEIEVFKNRKPVKDMSRFLQEKYDWLDNYCLVYMENIFIDYDFGEKIIKISGPKGRFGIIFYQEKSAGSIPLLQKDSCVIREIIREIDKDCWFSDAARINRELIVKLSESGFSLWGWATVKAIRMISIPLINIPVVIGSNNALNCFEISGTWTKAFSDVGGHKHLCLFK